MIMSKYFVIFEWRGKFDWLRRALDNVDVKNMVYALYIFSGTCREWFVGGNSLQ